MEAADDDAGELHQTDVRSLKSDTFMKFNSFDSHRKMFPSDNSSSLRFCTQVQIQVLLTCSSDLRGRSSTTFTYCKLFISGLVLEYFYCSKGSEYFMLARLSDSRLHSVMMELLLHVSVELSLISRLHLQRTLSDEELLVKIGHVWNMAAALLQRLRRRS